MLFNSFDFLFLFLPLIVSGFFVPRMRRWRVEWLLLGSFLFYGISGLHHLLAMIFSILWVYGLTRTDVIRGNKLRLTLAIIGPLGALLYFKYSNFILSDIFQLDMNGSEETFSLFRNVVLPAGISFFTFQLIGYAIDRFTGCVEAAPPLRRFALYISFFPQLVAGPILRFEQVSEPLAKLLSFRLSKKDLFEGIAYICFGLSAKILLADGLNYYITPYVNEPIGLSVANSAYVVLGYSFQIYFDFYGYSLIAIGLGRLFGFKFPDNFRRPYDALNPRDFWRRWHISLSYWIQDYLYRPLGGNEQYKRNILIVFIICGLWHGAGWNFVAWGLFHAVLVIVYHVAKPVWDRLPSLIQWAMNFVLVSLGWTLFLFDFEGARDILISLSGGGSGAVTSQGASIQFVVLIVAAFVCFGVKFERLIEEFGKGPTLSRVYGVGLAFLVLVFLLLLERSATFIYFRF